MWICFLQGGGRERGGKGELPYSFHAKETELEFVWFYKFGIVCIFVLSIKVNSGFFLKHFLEPLNVW